MIKVKQGQIEDTSDPAALERRIDFCMLLDPPKKKKKERDKVMTADRHLGVTFVIFPILELEPCYAMPLNVIDFKAHLEERN